MESTDGELPIIGSKDYLRKLGKKKIRVRKAEKKDAAGILRVAASVGTGEKDSYRGFLMENYAEEPVKFLGFFARMAEKLDFFYIARDRETIGFLMAYTREQWLDANPGWMENVKWSPEFETAKTGSFVMVDKIAIMRGHEGKGVGSAMYSRFISDLKLAGIEGIFSETVIYPVPNFASLSFRMKQKHLLAGVRYEEYKGEIVTDAVYYKPVL